MDVRVTFLLKPPGSLQWPAPDHLPGGGKRASESSHCQGCLPFNDWIPQRRKTWELQPQTYEQHLVQPPKWNQCHDRRGQGRGVSTFYGAAISSKVGTQYDLDWTLHPNHFFREVQPFQWHYPSGLKSYWPMRLSWSLVSALNCFDKLKELLKRSLGFSFHGFTEKINELQSCRCVGHQCWYMGSTWISVLAFAEIGLGMILWTILGHKPNSNKPKYIS